MQIRQRGVAVAAMVLIALLLLLLGGVAVARPSAQDSTFVDGMTGVTTLFRDFGTYQAETVALAPYDDETGASVMIDVVHHEVHEGEMFHASHTNVALGNGDAVDLLFSVGSAVDAHAVFEVFAGGQVTVSLYESPTVGATGTALAEYNMARPITRTASSEVYHTPTISDTGSVALVNNRVLPGGNSPQTRVGGGIRSGAEWILAPGVDYLLRVRNTSGGTIAVNIGLEWYEED